MLVLQLHFIGYGRICARRDSDARGRWQLHHNADRELRRAHALKEVKERLGALFGRIEPRRAALSFLDGLLSGIERKTGWQLAERVGDPGPWRMQAVLGRGHWDADAARDLVRTYVIEELGAAERVEPWGP